MIIYILKIIDAGREFQMFKVSIKSNRDIDFVG